MVFPQKTHGREATVWLCSETDIGVEKPQNQLRFQGLRRQAGRRQTVNRAAPRAEISPPLLCGRARKGKLAVPGRKRVEPLSRIFSAARKICRSRCG